MKISCAISSVLVFVSIVAQQAQGVAVARDGVVPRANTGQQSSAKVNQAFQPAGNNKPTNNKSGQNQNQNQSKSQNQAQNNQKNKNQGTTTTAVAAAASSAAAKGQNNNGQNNNKDQATTTTAAAAAASSAAAKGQNNQDQGTTTTSAATATSSATTSNDVSSSANNNAAASNNNSTGNGDGFNPDPNKSLCLNPALIQPNLAKDGNEVPEAGQIAANTTTNNFINDCLNYPQFPITNGQQLAGGSCNPTTMGMMIPAANLPMARIVQPPNFTNITANKAFTINIAVAHLDTGNFVNAASNYAGGPAGLNAQGDLVAHSHVVCGPLANYQDPTVPDARNFTFFKGLNAVAVDGILSANVTAGFPQGTYKCCTINTSAYHMPPMPSIAQHLSGDDCSYFMAVDDNGANTDANAASNQAAAATTAAAAAAAASASPAKAKGGANSSQGKKNNKFGRNVSGRTSSRDGRMARRRRVAGAA